MSPGSVSPSSVDSEASKQSANSTAKEKAESKSPEKVKAKQKSSLQQAASKSSKSSTKSSKSSLHSDKDKGEGFKTIPGSSKDAGRADTLEGGAPKPSSAPRRPVLDLVSAARPRSESESKSGGEQRTSANEWPLSDRLKKSSEDLLRSDSDDDSWDSDDSRKTIPNDEAEDF